MNVRILTVPIKNWSWISLLPSRTSTYFVIIYIATFCCSYSFLITQIISPSNSHTPCLKSTASFPRTRWARVSEVHHTVLLILLLLVSTQREAVLEDILKDFVDILITETGCFEVWYLRSFPQVQVFIQLSGQLFTFFMSDVPAFGAQEIQFGSHDNFKAIFIGSLKNGSKPCPNEIKKKLLSQAAWLRGLDIYLS